MSPAGHLGSESPSANDPVQICVRFLRNLEPVSGLVRHARVRQAVAAHVLPVMICFAGGFEPPPEVPGHVDVIFQNQAHFFGSDARSPRVGPLALDPDVLRLHVHVVRPVRKLELGCDVQGGLVDVACWGPIEPDLQADLLVGIIVHSLVERSQAFGQRLGPVVNYQYNSQIHISSFVRSEFHDRLVSQQIAGHVPLGEGVGYRGRVDHVGHCGQRRQLRCRRKRSPGLGSLIRVSETQLDAVRVQDNGLVDEIRNAQHKGEEERHPA